MILRQRDAAAPFVTKDGSTIRSLLDKSNAPVQNQSLAEAILSPGTATQAHRHGATEEFYYVLEGAGRMRVGAEETDVTVGDAILIPPGAVHQLRNTGVEPLKILCCCAPAYAHEDTFLEEPGG